MELSALALRLTLRLRQDAEILRFRGGFPTIAAELDEAAETIERAERAFDTLTRAIEAEGYSVFVDPEGNYTIELAKRELST